MKIPADLDPNPPPPLEEFRDPPLYYITSMLLIQLKNYPCIHIGYVGAIIGPMTCMCRPLHVYIQGRIQDLWKGGRGAAATTSAAGAKVFGGSRLKTLFGISKGGARAPCGPPPPPESASDIVLIAVYTQLNTHPHTPRTE